MLYFRNLEEFQDSRVRKYRFLGHAFFIGTGFLGISIWLVCLLIGVSPLIGISIFLIIFSIGICVFYFYSWQAKNLDIASSNDYWKYLETIDVEMLKQASASPELSNASRFAVVSYLNEHHPGWSLSSEIR